MNFDEIQSLWAGQEPADARTRALAENQRPLVNAFKRRQRFLAYEAFGLVFGLIFTPLLSVVNFLYRPSAGTPLYWTNAVLHLMFLVVCAVLAYRRVKRQRGLARAVISSLRQQAEISLASLEEEKRDYRWVPLVLGLGVGLALLSVAANTPFHGGSFSAVSLRVGMIVGFFGIVGAVLKRHYHVNVLPDYARQQEILRQLG
ncbi:MAG: hypothetical protein QM715_04175 [Nibricoccus sp.]